MYYILNFFTCLKYIYIYIYYIQLKLWSSLSMPIIILTLILGLKNKLRPNMKKIL